MLFHIIGNADRQAAMEAGRYAPPGLASEGFIHLSARSQILRPANLLYQGRSDLVLLVIDPDKLENDVVYEPGSHGEAEDFPHLYGTLNLDAIVDVVEFPCGPDGGFELPQGLRD